MFYTKPESRLNAHAKRRSQAALLLELEKDHDVIKLQGKNKNQSAKRKLSLKDPNHSETPDTFDRRTSSVKNNIKMIEFTKDLEKTEKKKKRVSRSNSKYKKVKSRVYDHFDRNKQKRILKHKSSMPSFAPKLCKKSMKIAENLEKSEERLQRAKSKRSIDSGSRFRSRSPIAQSKSINDKILWSNLERDLVECIQLHDINEPLVVKQESFDNSCEDKQPDIELILQCLGMCTSNMSYSFIKQAGKAKEKLLISKMTSILTPRYPIPNVKEGISFENILIFCATVSNIEIPYKDSVKKEARMRNLKDFMVHTNSLDKRFTEYSLEFENVVCKSLYKYGSFNDQGTILFSSNDKVRLSKEFIAFATSRREFISQRNKEKAMCRMEDIRNEFDHMPRINQRSYKREGIRDISSQRLPVHDTLLLKGQEYQEKKQIKQNIEQDIHGQECTFKPVINPSSHRLGDEESRFERRLYDDFENSRIELQKHTDGDNRYD